MPNSDYSFKRMAYKCYSYYSYKATKEIQICSIASQFEAYSTYFIEE